VKRRVFNVLTAVSLAACAATAALWARSYVCFDSVSWSTADHGWRLVSFRGQFAFASVTHLSLGNGFLIGAQPRRPLPETDDSFFGFAVHSSTGNFEWCVVTFPHWSLALAFAVPGALRAVRPRAKIPGACRHCGYDLRATPDRCPECGTSAAGRAG
jgi:hypothetical protein